MNLIFVSFYYACIGFDSHGIPVLLMVLGLIFTLWILNTDLISEEKRIKYSVVILSRVISPGELLIVSIGDFCIPIMEILFGQEIPANPDLYAAIFIVYLFFIFAYELYKGTLKER